LKLFQLAGSTFFVLRNVLDILTSTFLALAHSKRVFTILIVSAISILVGPPGFLTKSLGAVTGFVGAAQLFPYAVPHA